MVRGRAGARWCRPASRAEWRGARSCLWPHPLLEHPLPTPYWNTSPLGTPPPSWDPLPPSLGKESVRSGLQPPSDPGFAVAMKARLVPWRHLLSRHVFGISASFCFLRPDCTSGVETGVTALRETSVFIESWHRRSGRIPAPVASCTSSAFLNLIPSFAHPQDSIRAVLGNLDNLQPFATEHFIVFPYKSKWERVSHLKFKHGEIVLVPYPFVFTLYVEMKWFHENLSPGEPINDSPLGLMGSSLHCALVNCEQLWKRSHRSRVPL
ncbi:membrane-anchored junction protein isoform X5 [Lutra lutra]|uniref:membrane-anchored junction protein isoform X5 n=1 Tax=Lutra lutra TaxID=9657 RepID=UPI001FD3A23D|nr:membrane-anchored junction protein isoform X5 [Lutra lutra]